jgi:S1-C subfamily serine protease
VNLVDGQGSSAWTGHPKPEVDVAVIQVNFQQLKEDAMQAHFFRSDVQTATIGRIRELGITEGDFAYVLGFPMGLIVGQQSAVIVRSGSIARMRGILSGASDTFLVDAFVFPGNSGGPVILKPDVIAIAGTKPQQNALLIGIVQAYVPYTDVAISLQTQQPRVVFQENSGLTSVHAVDHIEETIEAAKGKDLGVYSGTA